MKIYHHNPVTGDYTGESDARPDPLELENAAKAAGLANPDSHSITVVVDKWLIPAHATQVKPPVEGDTRYGHRFVGGAWEKIPAPPPPTNEQLTVAVAMKAQAELNATQQIVYDCFEHGAQVPADVVAYRDALRAIIKNPSKDAVLPAKPSAAEGL